MSYNEHRTLFNLPWVKDPSAIDDIKKIATLVFVISWNDQAERLA